MSDSYQKELLAILFVTDNGDRLLFKYPIESNHKRTSGKNQGVRNPYAIKITEDFNKDKAGSRRGVLAGLSDVVLGHLLNVKSPLLCGQKLNLKVEEVRFVGFPLQISDGPDKPGTGKRDHRIRSFNIAFVLQASHGPWIVSCYQDIAKQLTVALKHEERRCGYLSAQAKIMTMLHDEVASLPEDQMTPPYESILQKSELARQLQSVFESLNYQGVAHLYINNFVEINFCLPHKLQAGYKPFKNQPEAIKKCLKSLRPYHGMLLLQDEQTLLDSLPIDCTLALTRLIQVANPVRSLQTLALEADLSLFQVFQLVCHLVYWAKAIIIYPLCETNIYVLSPMANTHVSSKWVEEFTQEFPGRSLPVELSDFSFPTQLRETQSALSQPGLPDMKVRMVVWMLQHHLLLQLHTYIFFVPPVKRRTHKISEEMSKVPIIQEDWALLEGGIQRSPSFSDAASVTSDDSVTLSTPGMLVAQLSKSPSTEFTGDGSIMSEENKIYWVIQESFANLAMQEKECIMNVPAAKNLDDLRMFARLFPYFSGKNHIEEIMYFENLRRSQLMTLIEKFREVLVLCTYEDPAASMIGVNFVGR